MEKAKTGKMDEVKAVIAEKGRLVAQKAKDLQDVAKLKGQIFTCEEVIRKNTMEIGQMVFADYEARKESEEEGELCANASLGKTDCEKQCINIANAKIAIAELKKQIKAIQQKNK